MSVKTSRRRRPPFALILLGSLCLSVSSACSSDSVDSNAGQVAGAGGAAPGAAGTASQGATAGAAAGTPGAGGALSAGAGGGASNVAGAFAGGGATSGGGSGPSGAGAGFGGTAGAGGATSAGAGGATSAGAAGTVAGSGGTPPAACGLPTPVSFQKNIQGFLATSCGKAVSGGCHVTDANKTSLGYNHAYDWITAFAHASSCGKVAPYATRFEVVLAVINGAKPASCPNSRQMPPPGSGAPALTVCQIAALQAWLAEPRVTQTHVTVSDDTAALYPPGPYAMPPFN